jgi:ABC-type dipeptide/oligopeptide/nickel transport system ATPase component
MLTFEEKTAIIESFPELKKKNVSLGRVNYHYEDSSLDKTALIYHLHPNGNGFVYAAEINGYKVNEKGLVNIRDFNEHALRMLIQEAINSLSPIEPFEEAIEEKWANRDKQSLLLVKEDDMWNVYAGVNLDGTFNTYKEAAQYLDEEGFRLTRS